MRTKCMFLVREGSILGDDEAMRRGVLTSFRTASLNPIPGHLSHNEEALGMKKWVSSVTYTVIGAVVGSTLMAMTPALAAQDGFKSFVANLEQDGQVVSKPSAILFNGTNYFGIWWIQQQLLKDGITVNWNGTTLSLNNMPIQQTDTLSASSNANSSLGTAFTNTINVNGVTYVPLSSVQGLLQQLGSKVQLKSGHDSKDAVDGENQPSTLKGSIHILKHVAEKLSEYSSEDMHSQGHGEGKIMSSFAGSLAQLQTVIDNLQNLVSTQSAPSTVVPTPAGNTTSTSTSPAIVTGATTSAALTTSAITQVQTVVTSLQSDYQALNQFALSTATAAGLSNSGTSVNLVPVISDINAQVKVLESLGQPSNTDSSANTGDN